MNRKHNPLVALVALLLLAVLLLCAGCSGVAAAEEPEEPEEPETPKRLTIESYFYADDPNIDYISIITDTETGVQYIFVDGYKSGGLTVLQTAPEEVTTP